MQYWFNHGFGLSGTTDKDVLLASNPRKRQYLLVRFNWFTDEYRQDTPIVHTEADALAFLSQPAAPVAA
ncbi:hypothetical protein SEA_ATUIN_318 [Arthrobacter phage Atuin]|nr:hypothetical protein SEA_ATUIN_117 [Arthrobacter phage Atuin]